MVLLFCKTSLITCGIGLICTKYWIYNPKSYFESARSKINDNKSLMKFIEDHFECISQDFMVNLNKRYSEYDLPLAHSFFHIKNLIKDSNLIVEWLNIVIDSDNIEEELQREAEKILNQFDSLYFAKMHEALLVIKEDPNFLSQMQVLEQQEATRQLRIANSLQASANFNQSLHNIGGSTHYVKFIK